MLDFLGKNGTGKTTTIGMILGLIAPAAGEAVLHPRVAARVIQEMQGAASDHRPVFSESTERELEVLRLIADGLSNANIAGRLVLSEKTVKEHVSNILVTLHLGARTQAAARAWYGAETAGCAGRGTSRPGAVYLQYSTRVHMAREPREP